MTVSSREEQLKRENAAKDAKMAEMQALAERQAKQMEQMMKALQGQNAQFMPLPAPRGQQANDENMGVKNNGE